MYLGGAHLKDLNLLVWLTQLGLSVAVPLAGFVLLAVWLKNTFALGSWVLWVGICLGILSAIKGLRQSLQTMARFSEKKEDVPPPVSFNEHD